jgi:hypothetical protein
MKHISEILKEHRRIMIERIIKFNRKEAVRYLS